MKMIDGKPDLYTAPTPEEKGDFKTYQEALKAHIDFMNEQRNTLHKVIDEIVETYHTNEWEARQNLLIKEEYKEIFERHFNLN